MTAIRDRAGLRETTKRTLAGLSHAVEETAEAAAADATIIALFQYGAYFAPMQRRYERLAAGGANVIVGYSGGAPTSGAPAGTAVHHVEFGADNPLGSEWSVALITPTAGAYVRGLDLVDFDPRECDLESGRVFRATWGFDRLTAADHVERLLDGVAAQLDPTVVTSVRAAVTEARRSPVTLPERALGATAKVLADRLEAAQRELADTSAALAKETDLATRDPLTGLLNREGLERWLGGPTTDGLPIPAMGVILIDLDGFKSVNDTFGHLVGDRLLSEVAESLLAATRPEDVAARWGGDEFIVLCPRTTDEELELIADRLLAAIGAVEVDGAQVSASAGIKTCSRRPLPLDEADAALYAAKHAGGARATVATT